MTLGQRIKYHRKRCGYTQQKFANLLNISPQAISKWENDRSMPDILTLSKIASLLQLTFDELVEGLFP
ncbi:MAG: helix-turn-helix transcriptional regulator [Clostridia bacterium]|nr:helix-turn-helix transcriptional regulator [Clostridia bacterium]